MKEDMDMIIPRNNEKDVTPRAHAAASVKYFDRVARESGQEVWKYGLSTAREWLRLIDADSVSPTEVSAFIGVVHANRYRTSGWFDLALGVYHWARTNGFPVSPPDDFWATETLPGLRYKEVPLREHAEMLVKHFKQYACEDPNQEVWQLGLDTAQEWLRLIDLDSVSQVEVSALIDVVCENRHKTSGWFDLALGIYHWSSDNGFSTLWPEDFQSVA
jgi:hypothetical protein